jgi:hypothetical protein
MSLLEKELKIANNLLDRILKQMDENNTSIEHDLGAYIMLIGAHNDREYPNGSTASNPVLNPEQVKLK